MSISIRYRLEALELFENRRADRDHDKLDWKDREEIRRRIGCHQW